MKTKFGIFTILMILAIGISSCTKKNGDNKGLNDGDKKPFDIMPTTNGSWWLYKADDGSIFYRYATGRDSFVENLTYDYFYRIDTTSALREKIPEFFGKNGDKYISLIDLDGSYTSFITYVILKDNWYKGMSWTNTEQRKLQGWNVQMYIQSNVLNVEEVLTINGKTYDSVVHVYNKLQAKTPFLPTYTNVGTLEVWFKKGIGIIKEKGDIDISPAGISLVSKKYGDELLDYYFVP